MGTNDDAVRNKAMAQSMTLAQIMTYAKEQESSTSDKVRHPSVLPARQIKSEPNQINQLRAQTAKTKPMSGGKGSFRQAQQDSSAKKECGNCTSCGYALPHAGKCPAMGQVCKKCGNSGHFSRVCLSKKNAKSNTAFQLTTAPATTDIKSVATSTGQKATVATQQYSSRLSEAEAKYYTTWALGDDARAACPRIDVQILGADINMGVDTQASVTAISHATFLRMPVQPVLQSCTTKTFAYAGEKPIDTMGQFTTTITCRGNSITETVIVLKDVRGNLLGFDASQRLKLVSILFMTETEDKYKEDIVATYPQLFTGRVGKLVGPEIELDIDPTVNPVFQAERRIPLRYRDKVTEVLKQMEADDVIEDAKPPFTWVSEMVCQPKPSNPDEIRITIDMKPANLAIKRVPYHSPLPEDVAAELADAEYMSKLDMTGSFHQAVLSEKSRNITTFRTPLGMKRYKRLVMGILCSTEVFQNALAKRLSGLAGVRNLVDDILVWGATSQEHDERLHALMKRLVEIGVTLNPKKCEFKRKEIEFFGLKLCKNGVSLTEGKIAALRDAAPPKSSAELHSFLGLANHCSKFIPRLSEKCAILWDLKKSKTYEWTAAHDDAFRQVKESIVTTPLGHFKRDWKTVLEVDAGPLGVAAVLYQRHQTNTFQMQILAFWSQLLSDVEQRYSQCEKESLAVVVAMEHFELYLVGAEFELITDNEAVKRILNNPMARPPPRIERMFLRIMHFTFKCIHKPGLSNNADYLSRNPVASRRAGKTIAEAEQFIKLISSYAVPSALTRNQLIEATKSDPVLQRVMEMLACNRFTKEEDVRPYRSVANELSQTQDGLLLRGRTIVVPSSLRLQVAQLAHEGHQGIDKTKRRLREYAWFPGIDKLIESIVQECAVCELNAPSSPPEPVSSSELPPQPWQRLTMDYHGPLDDGSELLVVVDEYSRYPVVKRVTSTAAKHLIPILDDIFASFGIPEIIRSDNGPPFNGEEFASYCKHQGIKHQPATPGSPWVIGIAEVFNKSLLKVRKAACNARVPFQEELNRFLRAYRDTPHSSTGASPASLLLRAGKFTRLPEIGGKEVNEAQVRDNDAHAKQRMKDNNDDRRRAKHHDLKVGDKVLFNQLLNQGKIHNKEKNRYLETPFTVENVAHSQVTAVSDTDGQRITRNCRYFKRLKSDGEISDNTDTDDNDPDAVIEQPDAAATIPESAHTEPDNADTSETTAKRKYSRKTYAQVQRDVPSRTCGAPQRLGINN